MANFTEKRMLGGDGILRGPDSGAQFNRVVRLVGDCLPLFAVSAKKDGIENENGLNRQLSQFITNVSKQKGLPFFSQPESMENEMDGGSPAVDIGIHLYVDDVSSKPPMVTVFEGKRLTTKLGKMRRREYVFGHEEKGKHIPCGGIERFKKSIHARKFMRAGMIGYIQDGTSDNWYKQVNTWISDLTQQDHKPTWLKKELLALQQTKDGVTTSTSVVYRHGSQMQVTHLWIDLSGVTIMGSDQAK